MSLKVFIQDETGARQRLDGATGLDAKQPDDSVTDASALIRDPAGQTELAVQRLPGTKIRREDEERAEAESSTGLSESQLEVAASEATGAASDAAPDAGAAPQKSEAAAASRTATPAPESSGWLPEGFWIKSAGAALIGGIALATDDDDSDSDQSSNSAPFITSNGSGASAAVSAAENGTAVTKVTAGDADSDTLTYSLTGGDDAALFQINASDGTLTFLAAPDFESPQDKDANNAYSLVVTVSDGDLSDTQTITVTVGNVDEDGNEPPAISSNGGGSTATVNVAENATAVTTVVASDVDAGSSVTYSIGGGADASLFSINANSGALRFVAAPNFENPQDVGADKDYEVIVTASDGSLTDSQTLTVRVTNVDEAPAITSNEGGTSAAISIAEGVATVTTVTATDPDADATLVYSISGGVDSALFTIDKNSGALTFSAVPDFENPQDKDANNVYNLVVAVSDGKSADTQTITVTVGNVDEDGNEPPFITSNGGSSAATVNIAENTAVVTTVVASDIDVGSSVTYSIGGGADSSLFSIDANSGVLRFVAAPNFENPQDVGTDKDYEVIVTASDGSLADSQTLTVRVIDVDEAPTITSNEGGTSAAISIAEGVTTVTTVTATDPDAGATLVYSISSGADSALFTIDKNSGALSFKSPPDFDAPGDQGQNNVYNLVVAVSDGKSADTQSLAITVTDVVAAAALSASEDVSDDTVEARALLETAGLIDDDDGMILLWSDAAGSAEAGERDAASLSWATEPADSGTGMDLALADFALAIALDDSTYTSAAQFPEATS